MSKSISLVPKRAFSLFLSAIWLLITVPTEALESKETRTEKASTAKTLSTPIRDKWAVVIGIDKFKDKTIPSLQYASKDAQDFANFLAEKGNFARDHIKVLLNEGATEDNILDTLGGNWLPRRVLKDDLVVIFVSTHGSPKELDHAGENFLIAYDTLKEKLYASGIRLSDLGPGIQKRTGCNRVVLLLDACNSGAAKAVSKGLYRNLNFDINNISARAGEGLVVISSSSADQRSWESKRYKNGVFTKNLISALDTQKNASERKIESVFEGLKDSVEQEVRFDRKVIQTPVMSSKWKGAPLNITCKPSRPRVMKFNDEKLESSQQEVKPTDTVYSDTKNQSEAISQSNNIEETKKVIPVAPAVSQTVSKQNAESVTPHSGQPNPHQLALLRTNPGFTPQQPPTTKNKDALAIIGILPPPRPFGKRKRQRKIARAKEMNFPRQFRDILARQLTFRTGKQVIGHDRVVFTMSRVFGKQKPNFVFPNRRKLKTLGQQLQAKNLVIVQISQMKINERNRFGPMYNINMVAKVFDGESGRQKATIRKYAAKPANRQGNVKELVYKRVIPGLADQIAIDVAKKI